MSILIAAWTVQFDSGPVNEFQIYLVDLPKIVPRFIAVGCLFERGIIGGVIGVAVYIVFAVIAAALGWPVLP